MTSLALNYDATSLLVQIIPLSPLLRIPFIFGEYASIIEKFFQMGSLEIYRVEAGSHPFTGGFIRDVGLF